jgi:hypothetical protein
VLARQAFDPYPQPFFPVVISLFCVMFLVALGFSFSYFSDRISCFLPKSVEDHSLPTCACLAEIIGVSHHTQPEEDNLSILLYKASDPFSNLRKYFINKF